MPGSGRIELVDRSRTRRAGHRDSSGCRRVVTVSPVISELHHRDRHKKEEDYAPNRAEDECNCRHVLAIVGFLTPSPRIHPFAAPEDGTKWTGRWPTSCQRREARVPGTQGERACEPARCPHAIVGVDPAKASGSRSNRSRPEPVGRNTGGSGHPSARGDAERSLRVAKCTFEECEHARLDPRARLADRARRRGGVLVESPAQPQSVASSPCRHCCRAAQGSEAAGGLAAAPARGAGPAA